MIPVRAAGAAAQRAAGRVTSRLPPRPTLALVPPTPARAPRAPFVVLVVGLLASGLVVLLLLNTVLAQDAFVLDRLHRRVKLLGDREQALAEAVARAQAPDTLAARARALGLVPSDAPAFLDLPSGRVLGEPRPAPPPPPPPPAAAPTRPHERPDPAQARAQARDATRATPPRGPAGATR
ncbi:MAG: hypothetical protein ACM3ZF_01355 [Mycobacterium leprae]